MKVILPLPETTNTAYKFAGRHMYKTDKAKVWEKEAYYILKKLRQKMIIKPVSLQIGLYLKRDRDIDGSLKPILDCLQLAGIIKNDSQIELLSVAKLVSKENPRVEIEIERLS